jgi:D-aminopeptidase
MTPTTPGISDASVVNGYVNAANDTPSQALTGTADTGDTVNVYLNGAVTPAFTTAADASGNWSVPVGALADGSYSYAATASDVAGNTASSAPLTFTVDTTTSESAIADGAVTTGRDGKSYINGANFNGGSTALTGTAEAGDTVSVSLNGGTAQAAAVASDGTWSLTLNGLTDGTAYSAVATATDAAGNTAQSPAFGLTVDTTTSESAIADFGAVTTGTDGKSYLNAANFNGGTIFLTGQMEPGDIATVSVNINGSPSFVPATGTVQGTWQATLTGLVDGESVSAVATASDVAGNTASSAPLTFTVDTTTPTTPGISDASVVNGYVNAANDTPSQALTGTADAGDTVNVYLNGAVTPAFTTAADASGNWSVPVGALADGSYSYAATATDAAGNVSAPSAPYGFTVDTTTSTIGETVTLAPGRSPSILVSGVATDVDTDLATVTMNGGSTNLLGTDGDWTYSQIALASGSHSYVATITDKLGLHSSVTGSVVTVNNANNVALAGMIGGDTVNASTGNSQIGITDTAANGGHNIINATNGNNKIAISDGAGYNTVNASGGNNAVTINDTSGDDNTLSVSGGNNKVAVTDGAGNNTVNASGGNNAVTINDASGGDNTLTAGGANNSISITDILGKDSVTLAGGNNKVTIGGPAGGDTITADTNDAFIYTHLLSHYDTLNNVFNGGTSSNDVFNLSALAGATKYQGTITGGTLNADSVGFLYNSAQHETSVFVNTTGAAESLSAISPMLELAGSGTLTAANFKV